MSCYKRTEVDPTILSLLTEADVCLWLVARLARMRQEGVPAHSLGLNAWYRKDEDAYDVSWTGYALGKCAVACDEALKVHQVLRQELFGASAALAKQKRDEAEQLLNEAQELDAMSGAAPATT